MKKFLYILALVTLLILSVVLVGCDDSQTPSGTAPSGTASGGTASDGTPPAEDKTIEGVTLDNATHTYDGTQKAVAVSGALPEGVTVAYTNATATDAGTYNVTAVLSGEGYKTLTLTSTLTITPAAITGITADAEQSVTADGDYHIPAYSGNLPAGVTVKLVVNGQEMPIGIKALGTHDAKLVFSGKNHQTLELPITFKLTLNAIKLASDVISSFGTTPDPWDLLPESFGAAYHTVSTAPSFTNFTSISAIPVNGIGKQMNTAYGLLNKTSKALSYVNVVMDAMNGIKTLYTNYLDTNPTDYQNYTGSISGLTFTLALSETGYSVSATVSSVGVVIWSDIEANTYGARVQLTATTALKYTVSEDSLIIAMNVLNSGSTLLEFSRDEDDNVVGMLYEYLTVAGVEAVANSAMITVGEDYTTIIGTKGDFLLGSEGRNCEIYNNDTGRLVGAEVREVSAGVEFNTYWFALNDVNGLSSIKYDGEDFYINGYTSDALANKKMGVSFTLKALSRRFDVEMKTMYFYAYNSDTDEYETVFYEIPMIFVQEEVYDYFDEDFSNVNEDALNGNEVELQIRNTDIVAIDFGYEVLLPIYDTLKDAVTQQDIIDYCSQ